MVTDEETGRDDGAVLRARRRRTPCGRPPTTTSTWVVDRFVDAALRAQRAGFDGIELHGGHGYLLHAFASPASNQRDDRWGGSVEARAELLVTVVRAVRAAVGPDFPLWARIGMFEAHRDPGQRPDDALVTMGLAVDAGLDAVHVTAYGEPMVATGIVDGHTPAPARRAARPRRPRPPRARRARDRDGPAHARGGRAGAGRRRTPT